MLRNKTIFILSLMKFDGLPSTNYTIARHLAKHNTVYYIDHPFTIKDCWSNRNHNSYQIRKSFFSPFSDGIMKTDLPNLKVVITPPVLPINWMSAGRAYNLLLKFNEAIILKRIKKIIKEQQIEEYIFINFFDFHYPNVGVKLTAALNIYYCVDPIIVPYDRKHGLSAEHQLVKNSDLIICTSKALYDDKLRENPETYLVPNAVDLDLVSQALDPELPEHPLLKNIPKPIIGYIGNIERRFDFEILVQAISDHQDKSFVLAGPYNEDVIPDDLRHFKNLFFTGPIEYKEIPAMLKGFDLCLIPFKKDEVSRTIFPLKLFEYLGAGKPVIASDFNMDLSAFTHDAVKYCDNADSLSRAIDMELQNNNKDKEMYRRTIAAENTWEKRVSMLCDIIEKFITK